MSSLPLIIIGLLTTGVVCSTEGTGTYDEPDEKVACVCDGGCDHLRSSDCVHGLTLDMCRCCLTCARGEGEPCGKAIGYCAFPLHCQIDRNQSLDQGICTNELNCQENLIKKHGCVVNTEGICMCFTKSTCPTEKGMFMFDSQDDCQSKLSFLMDHMDFEPAKSSSSATDECSSIVCSKIEECPQDSYRLPTIVDTNHANNCCPTPGVCVCMPNDKCKRPTCDSEEKAVIVSNGTSTPGSCCPTYRCALQSSIDKLAEEHAPDISQCFYDNKLLNSGESWMNQKECSECICRNGVLACSEIQCSMPKGCSVARPVPGSCCPVCDGCISASGKVYNNSESWQEDPCTDCKCVEGHIKCTATLCQNRCSHPHYVEGQCCPDCDGTEGAEGMKAECPISNCKNKCTHGFVADEKGCPTCSCNVCYPLEECFEQCPLGYKNDENGCPMCQCKEDFFTSYSSSRVGNDMKHCGYDFRGEPSHFHGERWEDKCHKCICRNGLELCSLISCPPVNCENPTFSNKHCCPSCFSPSDFMAYREKAGSKENHTFICQSVDGRLHSEGETWSLDPCLTCTCDNGEVFCSSEDCHASPCSDEEELSQMNTQDSCCPKCIPKNKLQKDLSDEGIYIVSTADGRCWSDHLQKEISNGESWKPGPCQSCLCENGKVNCFAIKKCPKVECPRPVLPKNQCCPVCLGSHQDLNGREENSHEKSSTCTISNSTYQNGEEWILDECTQCTCQMGTAFCTKRECHVSCTSPIQIPGKCCPICVDSLPEKYWNSDDMESGNCGDENRESSSLKLHCIILIGALGLVIIVVVVYFLRKFLQRRILRLAKSGVPTEFHSSSSHSSSVAPDCCYKCDDYKYNNAHLSEQKPLFHHSSLSSSSKGNSSMTNGSDKV